MLWGEIMKKFFLLCLLILGISLTACKSTEESPETVNIYMPDGTPALALASVLDDGFEYNETITKFNIVTASEIAARVSQDTCDLAILPTTAAANLFNRGINLKLASVNVFGNLFIVGTKSTSTLEDLKGKVILTTAETTIQMVQYVLKNNNIEFELGSTAVDGKVVLNSVADATAIIPVLKMAMQKGEEAYGVLGEPQVTKAQSVVEGLIINVDLQAEYKKITGFDGYPQACLIVKIAFSEKYPSYVEKLLEKLEGNSEYLNNNVTKLPSVFAKYESNLAGMTFTADTIKRCNLRVEKANTVKESVINYVKSLINIDLKDEFFYA